MIFDSITYKKFEVGGEENPYTGDKNHPHPSF
jgi:hypothetical protein